MQQGFLILTVPHPVTNFLVVLLNSKFHYRVYKSPPLVPILDNMMKSTLLHPFTLRSL